MHLVLQFDLVSDLIDFLFELIDDWSWSTAGPVLDTKTSRMIMTKTVNHRKFKRVFDMNYHVPENVDDLTAPNLTLPYDFHRQAVDAYRVFSAPQWNLPYSTVTDLRPMDPKTGRASQSQNTSEDYKTGWIGTEFWSNNYEREAYNINNLLHWLIHFTSYVSINRFDTVILPILQYGWIQNSDLQPESQLIISLELLHYAIHSRFSSALTSEHKKTLISTILKFISICFYNHDLQSEMSSVEAEILQFVRNRMKYK
jgi:hypothetical protein